MKQIIFGLLFLFTATVAFGQNQWQQKKIDYFVEAAAKEFKLDRKQEKQLSKSRTDYFLGYMEIVKKAKKGDISGEEKKNQLNNHNQNFNKSLKEITGEDNIQPFLVKMREELKSL